MVVAVTRLLATCSFVLSLQPPLLLLPATYLGLDNVIGVLEQKDAFLLWCECYPDSIQVQEPMMHIDTDGLWVMSSRRIRGWNGRGSEIRRRRRITIAFVG